MPLAGKDQNVARLGIRQRIADRFGTVGNIDVFAAGFLYIARDFGDDLVGVLKLRVVTCQNRQIAQRAGNKAQLFAADLSTRTDRTVKRDDAVVVIRPGGLDDAFETDAVVGVVDDYAVGCVGVHHLAAALDMDVCERFTDRFVRNAEAFGNRCGSQRVIGVDCAGEREEKRKVFPAKDSAARNAELMVPLAAGGVQQPHVGVLRKAVGHFGTRTKLCDRFAERVVPVEHGIIAMGKQLLFPAGIFLKRVVFVRADMVGRQIGEHGRVKLQTVHAVKLEPERRHFDRGGLAPGVGHHAQQLLQLVAFRRGVDGRQYLVAKRRAHGADDAGGDACVLEHGFDNMRRGGFSLGARNADHLDVAVRVAEKVARANRQRRTGVGAGEDHRVVRHVDRLFTQKDAAAGVIGVFGKNMAVGARTGQAHKHGARTGLSGIIGDVGDIERRIKPARHMDAL